MGRCLFLSLPANSHTPVFSRPSRRAITNEEMTLLRGFIRFGGRDCFSVFLFLYELGLGYYGIVALQAWHG